jgi:hypothetical protein
MSSSAVSTNAVFMDLNNRQVDGSELFLFFIFSFTLSLFLANTALSLVKLPSISISLRFAELGPYILVEIYYWRGSPHLEPVSQQLIMEEEEGRYFPSFFCFYLSLPTSPPLILRPGYSFDYSKTYYFFTTYRSGPKDENTFIVILGSLTVEPVS